VQKILTKKIDSSNILFYNLLSRGNVDFIIQESLKGHGKALDLGAGIGFMSYALSFNYKVLSVDKDLKSLNFIENKYGFDTVCIDLSKNTIPGGKYDLILLCEVIEEIPTHMHNKLIQDISLQLNHDGILIITTPSSDGLLKLKNPIYDYKKGGYNRDELVHLIKKAGLKIVNVQYSMIFISRLILEFQKLFINHSSDKGVQSRINNIGGTALFRLYKMIFPIVYTLSQIDKILAFFIKGTGLMISASKEKK